MKVSNAAQTNNWFFWHKPVAGGGEAAVITGGNTQIINNAYGMAEPKVADVPTPNP